MDEFQGLAEITFSPPTKLTDVDPAKVPSLMMGWQCRIKDSRTGEAINTVVSFDMHVSAEDIIWATFTMFVNQEGEPLYDAPIPLWIDEGEDFAKPHTGEFRYVITGVEVSPLVSSVKEPVSLVDEALYEEGAKVLLDELNES
jgi:hypothetical protein